MRNGQKGTVDTMTTIFIFYKIYNMVKKNKGLTQ